MYYNAVHPKIGIYKEFALSYSPFITHNPFHTYKHYYVRMNSYYFSAPVPTSTSYPQHPMNTYFDPWGVGSRFKSKNNRSMSFSASSRLPPYPSYLSSPASSYSSISQPYASTSNNYGHRTRARTYSTPNSTITIDPVLKYRPHPSDVPLNYDLSHPPSQATLTSSGSFACELSSSDLNRPATYPPVRKMRVTCSLLPWPITLYPLSDTRSTLTVGDVLEGLFRFLRKHASGDEWHSADQQTREDVRQAWMRRVRRQQTHKDREYERANGLRRIDWLDKTTVFQGLEHIKGTETWILHVRQAGKAVKFWTGS